jgi:hypothetical protein
MSLKDRFFGSGRKKKEDPEEICSRVSSLISALLVVHEHQFQSPAAAKLREHIELGTVGLVIADQEGGKRSRDRFWLSVVVDDRRKRALAVMVVNIQAFESNRGGLSREFGEFLKKFDGDVKSLNLQGIALDQIPRELVPKIVVRGMVKRGQI